MKLQSYALGEKVWLNSKYIKTKQNQKLEAKFFGPFQILHPVGKQTYKLDLSTKWKIHDVFHVSLLEQDITKKGRMNEIFPKLEPEFNAGNNKEYKVEAIIDSVVYVKEAKKHLPSLYYSIFWKSYPEEQSTWKPSFAVMHLWKIISTFHKDHPEKPIAISPPFNSAPPMAKPSVKPVNSFVKQKRDCPTSSTKRAKEWDIGQWSFFFLVPVRLKSFFTNSVNFRRDAHSASSSNFVSFYLWVVYCHCACYLRAIHCHCALYLWAAYCHRSSGFPPQSLIRLGGFSSNWSLGFPP